MLPLLDDCPFRDRCINYAPAVKYNCCLEWTMQRDITIVDSHIILLDSTEMPLCFVAEKEQRFIAVDEPAIAQFMPFSRHELVVRFGFKSLLQLEHDIEQNKE